MPTAPGMGVTPDGLRFSDEYTGVADNSPIKRIYSFPEFIADEWELVGEFTDNPTVTDFQATTKGTTFYVVEAVSNIPSSVLSKVSITADSDLIWLGVGPDYGQVAAIPYNHEVSEVMGDADAETHYFDGRPLPILVGSNTIHHAFTVSGTLDPEGIRGSTFRQLTEVAKVPGPHLYRDKDGNRAYIKLSDLTIARSRSTLLRNVSFLAEEVDSDGL